MTKQQFRDIVKRFGQASADKGLLVEAGWMGFEHLIPQADKSQLHDMRIAFFAGAAHTLFTIMDVMEAGEEPTDTDMKRMELLTKELDKFQKEFFSKVGER